METADLSPAGVLLSQHTPWEVKQESRLPKFSGKSAPFPHHEGHSSKDACARATPAEDVFWTAPQERQEKNG